MDSGVSTEDSLFSTPKFANWTVLLLPGRRLH